MLPALGVLIGILTAIIFFVLPGIFGVFWYLRRKNAAAYSANNKVKKTEEPNLKTARTLQGPCPVCCNFQFPATGLLTFKQLFNYAFAHTVHHRRNPNRRLAQTPTAVCEPPSFIDTCILEPGEQLWGVCVGLGEYGGDAKRIERALRDYTEPESIGTITVVRKEEEIKPVLEEASREVPPNAVFVFYISAHGRRDGGFCTEEEQPTSISRAELKEWLPKSTVQRPLKRIVIIDACHSAGENLKTAGGEKHKFPDLVESQLTGSNNNTKSRDGGESGPSSSSRQQLYPNGWVQLTACEADQQALGPDHGRSTSLFTHFLCRALAGKRCPEFETETETTVTATSTEGTYSDAEGHEDLCDQLDADRSEIRVLQQSGAWRLRAGPTAGEFPPPPTPTALDPWLGSAAPSPQLARTPGGAPPSRSSFYGPMYCN
eukprot:TRINITY_DN3671_c0_g1_i1.p1 TRINITY_DN3671_c0_g1~~TRINITY_DN3671_c0_g1_i1.p1  ORF type:complete len:431 (+),score=39.27 TRINITY_DN3671_c0_g1_i1:89-1381(+)